VQFDVILKTPLSPEIAQTQNTPSGVEKGYKYIRNEYLSTFNCNENINLTNMESNPSGRNVFSD
jgi:hypothetical protein